MARRLLVCITKYIFIKEITNKVFLLVANLLVAVFVRAG
jgi:hypothetical protein